MNQTFKSILGVLAGLVVGSAVNMAFILLGPLVIPPPAGADLTTSEGLLAAMHLMEPKHFVFPFLAHAAGAFTGGYLSARIAPTNKMTIALVVGAIFLVGGVINILMLPSPVWYSILDIVAAYLPMAYLGGKLAMKKS